MFPYTGQLAKATNGYVYTKEDVRSILQAAKDQELEVIPLVQTLGHLEWVLKLDAFLHLRDDPNSPTVNQIILIIFTVKCLGYLRRKRRRFRTPQRHD